MCRASSIKAVLESAPHLEPDPQGPHLITRDVYHVQSSPKGLFVDMDIGFTPAAPASSSLGFQVDSGCSRNTIHISDLNKLPPLKMTSSTIRLLDYSKNVIPTKGETTLHCLRGGASYNIVAQVITAQRYYAPLLGLPDIKVWVYSTMMLTLST